MTIRRAVMVQWFAGSDHIARMGPYKTQVEAWKALRAVPRKNVPLLTSLRKEPVKNRRIHVDGAYVWPEEA